MGVKRSERNKQGPTGEVNKAWVGGESGRRRGGGVVANGWNRRAGRVKTMHLGEEALACETASAVVC